jgi:aryl-alcohol dehydrogenase-like predicted oxidoreductase
LLRETLERDLPRVKEHSALARDTHAALLAEIDRIARRHDTTIGAIAVRWTLDQPGVAGVIVGARHAGHLARTVAATQVTLDDGDREAIARVQAASPGPSGDVYDLERVAGGRHAGIMRYNLNERA